MAKAFDKARKTTETKNNKKWYVIYTKNYSIYLWALPIAPFAIAIEKLNDWYYKRLEWNEQRATKVLNKVLPKVLEWVEEENAYYYCMNWGTSNLLRGAAAIDRKWARKFQYSLQNYIQDSYENADYTKVVEKAQASWDDTWVKFIEK